MSYEARKQPQGKKKRDADPKAQRAALHQRRERLNTVREQEATDDWSDRRHGGWPFPLGNFAGF